MSIPKLKIVVVGGGFSGSTFAIQLLRHLPDLPMASSTKARCLVVGSPTPANTGFIY